MTLEVPVRRRHARREPSGHHRHLGAAAGRSRGDEVVSQDRRHHPAVSTRPSVARSAPTRRRPARDVPGVRGARPAVGRATRSRSSTACRRNSRDRRQSEPWTTIPHRRRPTPTTTLLELRSVTVAFGGLLALGGIDLDVAQGERLAVLGPNGAGKTTLFNVVAGDLRPTAGTVAIKGVDCTRCRRGAGRASGWPAPTSGRACSPASPSRTTSISPSSASRAVTARCGARPSTSECASRARDARRRGLARRPARAPWSATCPTASSASSRSAWPWSPTRT